MKSKLLIFTIIAAVMLILLALPTVASTKVVDITRPEGNEVVTKDVFSICGVCLYDETTISFEYKDKETGKYKPLETTDGYSTFKVGSGKIFGKDVKLKYKGDNDIKIIAYTKDTKDDPQIKDYIITLGEEKKKGSWIDALTDWLGIKDKDKGKE